MIQEGLNRQKHVLSEYSTTQDVEFISFDVKSVGLAHPDRRDYDFSHLRTKEGREVAEIYLVVFEGIADYIAVVPRAVWNDTVRDLAHGILPLISQLPCLFQPFMVHESQLHQAFSNLVRGEVYVNPTTGVIFDGYKPMKTTQPLLEPRNELQLLSLRAQQDLWSKIDTVSCGAKVDLNPIPPYICDFLLQLPTVNQYLRIEHKLLSDLSRPLKRYSAMPGKDSTFSSNRLWHFIIIQHGVNATEFFCCARHEVGDAWASKKYPLEHIKDVSQFLFQGPQAVESMVESMRTKSSEAISFTDHIFQSLRPEDILLESLVTIDSTQSASNIGTDTEDLEKESVLQKDDKKAMREGKAKEMLGEDDEQSPAADAPPLPASPKPGVENGLHWVCDELNQQFRAIGKMICFPLDLYNPVGNHIVVKHDWTEEDKANFDKPGRSLPAHIFSHSVSNRTSIVMRFCDFSSSGSKGLPVMSARYWQKPIADQHFIFLANVLPPELAMAPLLSWYLLFPSEWTTIFDQGTREQPHPTNGEHYINRVSQSFHQLPNPSFKTSKPYQFEIGSPFIKPKGENPLRCMVKLHNKSICPKESLVYHLCKALENDEMRITNLHTGAESATFATAKYHTTPRQVLTLQWQFGGKIS